MERIRQLVALTKEYDELKELQRRLTVMQGTYDPKAVKCGSVTLASTYTASAVLTGNIASKMAEDALYYVERRMDEITTLLDEADRRLHDDNQ